jgi:hypothetical protein
MADAVETQVVLAVRDSLEHISPANGYHTRPRVEMGLHVPTPLMGPTILVSDSSGSRAERVVHAPPIWEHRMRVAVLCLAIGSGEDGRVRELGNLTADARRRLLRHDRTLGGLVYDVTEIEPDGTDESMHGTAGENRLDFEVCVRLQEEE